MEIASATGSWRDGTLAIANEFIDDLAASKMSATRLSAVFAYVGSNDYNARWTFVEIGRSLGSDGVRKWLDDREVEREQ
jgi:hypothetical protein